LLVSNAKQVVSLNEVEFFLHAAEVLAGQLVQIWLGALTDSPSMAGISRKTKAGGVARVAYNGGEAR